MNLAYSLLADLVDIVTLSILTFVTILIGRFAYHTQFSFSHRCRVWSALLKCLIFLGLQTPIVVSYFTFFTPTSTIFVWVGLALAVAVVFGILKLNIFPQNCLPINEFLLGQWARGELIKEKPQYKPLFLDCLHGRCNQIMPWYQTYGQKFAPLLVADECRGPLTIKPFVNRNNNRNFGPMRPFTHLPNDRVFGQPQCDFMTDIYSPQVRVNPNPRQPRKQKRRQQNNLPTQPPPKAVHFQKDLPCDVKPQQPAPVQIPSIQKDYPCDVQPQQPAPVPIPSSQCTKAIPARYDANITFAPQHSATQNVIVNQIPSDNVIVNQTVPSDEKKNGIVFDCDTGAITFCDTTPNPSPLPAPLSGPKDTSKLV